MTEGEILKMALEKEQASYKLYEDLLRQQKSVEFLRDLLEELRDNEARHIRLIEDRITDLNLGRG